jgi:hypothetical protein
VSGAFARTFTKKVTMKVSSSSVIVLAGALVATAFAIVEPPPSPANDNTPVQHSERTPTPIGDLAARRPVIHQD